MTIVMISDIYTGNKCLIIGKPITRCSYKNQVTLNIAESVCYMKTIFSFKKPCQTATKFWTFDA